MKPSGGLLARRTSNNKEMGKGKWKKKIGEEKSVGRWLHLRQPMRTRPSKRFEEQVTRSRDLSLDPGAPAMETECFHRDRPNQNRDRITNRLNRLHAACHVACVSKRRARLPSGLVRAGQALRPGS